MVLMSMISPLALAGNTLEDRVSKTQRSTSGNDIIFVDNFDAYPSPLWYVYWGKAEVRDGMYFLYSERAENPDETYSALSAVHATWENYVFTLRMKTEKQLRSDEPNPWEVAWVLFRFQDVRNFYYFILKTNGIELGKREKGDFFGPSSQIFLFTSNLPTLRLGEWYDIKIEVVNLKKSSVRIRVWLNNTMIINYLDNETTLLFGGIALYVEDSIAIFDNITVRKLP